MLALLLIVIAVVAANIFSHHYFINSYRSSGPSLTLTHKAFSYAGRTVPWADVTGIYSFNEVKKGGATISSVKIRINTREIITISVYYYRLDATKAPKLISAYKMNRDL